MTRTRNVALALTCIPVGLTIVLGAAPIVQDAPRATANALPELALEITDYAALPVTGAPDGAGNNAGSLARLNVLREEPGGLHRFFVNDLTGPLYILDKNTRKATTYLDFNGRGDRTGLFDKMPTDAGLASGFISFEFDPDYGRNGRFYTIHLEEIALPGALVPDNSSVPGLKVSGYTPTTPIPTPGAVDHEGVIVEWTDSNVSNATFEGTARELMRIPLNGRIHPLGDLDLQSGRAQRRRRLASAVHGLRRRRIRRSEDCDSTQPATPGYCRRQGVADRSGSVGTQGSKRGQRQRPLSRSA